jgi:hypothetical protein
MPSLTLSQPLSLCLLLCLTLSLFPKHSQPLSLFPLRSQLLHQTWGILLPLRITLRSPLFRISFQP